MKGLEATILPLSEAVADNLTARIDPEYFNKAAVAAFRKLKGGPRLKAFVKRGYRVVYENTNVVERGEGLASNLPLFLQSADIETPFINQESMVCVPESDWLRYPKGRIEKGEILIEVKGKAEKVAIVPKDFPLKTLVTGTCFKITTHEEWQRSVLISHLTGRYGSILKDRLKTNLLVAYIAKDDLYRIPIPNLSSNLSEHIHRAVEASLSVRNDILARQQEAADRLLNGLGLTHWKPPAPLTYSARASDMLTAQRFDAQYFRPIFAEVERRLLATGRAVELGTILTNNARGRQPLYADSGLPVVNSKHVRRNRVILDGNRTAIESSSSNIIEKGDVLINGTGVGTIGRAAPYLHEQRALPDNHVTLLRTSAVDPVYLAAFLNSPLGRWQIERHIKGSSGQVELYPNDIARIVFWDAPEEIQTSVRDAMTSAFREEGRANELLEAAKRAVEIAIEEGDSAAIAFLTVREEELLY